MKKTLQVLLIIIVLIGGYLLGAMFGPLWKGIEKNDQLVNTYSSAYPQLDFTPCESAKEVSTQAALTACAEGVLAQAAVMRQDAAFCEAITAQANRESCLLRLQRVAALTANEQAFCAGLTEDPICKDLARLLVVSDTQNIENCAGIQTRSLAQICSSLVLGYTAQQASEDLPPLDGPTEFTYGFQCAPGSQTCDEDRQLFNAAILSQDPTECDAVIRYKNHCLSEQALYISYLQQDSIACEQYLSPDACAVELVTARALDAEDVAICAELEDEIQIEACRGRVVDIAEKRFAYLE